MKVALDTNAYSDWRRDGRWAGTISSAQKVAIPVIVLGELRAGFRRGDRLRANEASLLQFLSEPVVEILHTTERTSAIYADFRDHLWRHGNPIPENDIWIAALVYESGLLLCTNDTHFENLPQVAMAPRAQR